MTRRSLLSTLASAFTSRRPDKAGISSAYGGVLSALEITYTLTPSTKTPGHHQEPFRPDAAALRTYVSREEVYAIYPHGKKLIKVDQRDVER